MSNEKKFWCLWVEGHSGPNQRYYSEETARLRADSLARTTGEEVYILEAMVIHKTDAPAVQPAVRVEVL